jgi:hypothetical protein
MHERLSPGKAGRPIGNVDNDQKDETIVAVSAARASARQHFFFASPRQLSPGPQARVEPQTVGLRPPSACRTRSPATCTGSLTRSRSPREYLRLKNPVGQGVDGARSSRCVSCFCSLLAACSDRLHTRKVLRSSAQNRLLLEIGALRAVNHASVPAIRDTRRSERSRAERPRSRTMRSAENPAASPTTRLTSLRALAS